MPAFLIAQFDRADLDTVQRYRSQILPTVLHYQGKVIASDSHPQTLEGDWRPLRVAVVEFPSMGHLQAWFGSPEYAPLLALRQPGSAISMVALEGVGE